MAEDQDRESKTQEPTAKRLQDARERGEFPKSAEIASLAGLAAVATTLFMGGGAMARSLAAALTPFLAHPDAMDLSGQGLSSVMRNAEAAGIPAMVIMLIAAVAGAAGNLIQQGFVFIPGKLAPDFAKLDPMQGIQRLFGLDNLINFAKTFAKFMTMVAVVWMVLKPRAALLQGLAAMDPAAILPLTMDLLRVVLIAAVLLLAITAGVDWFVQRQRFMSKMRMSREDVKQELKDSEGDPHIKARVKQIRAARAKRRIMQNVPRATLVITNPTHFAVALRYVQGETLAPICVAKGVDFLALKIREVAKAHEIAIVEDPPLARALYAVVDVDDAIPREHFQAVAKIVGFVMGAASRRARPVGPAPRPVAS